MQQHLWIWMEIHYNLEGKQAAEVMSGCMTAGSQVVKWLKSIYNT